jgi:transcriptional regulator, propionate catabolism operon regulatory protein
MDQKTKYRFAFLSNSAEVGEAVKAHTDPEIEDLLVQLASMEEAVPIAKRLLNQGTEVILSGWGTGSLLVRNIGLPIVKIERTYLDILNALIKAKDLGLNIGLTSFGSPIPGVEIFEQLLSIRVRQIVFNSTQDLIDGISAAFHEGVKCVVGGGICREIITTMGGEGVLVLPSKETIQQAFQEARAIAASRRREKQDASEIRAVLETITEGVVLVDNVGRIKVCNKVAAEILKIQPQDYTGRLVPEIMDDLGLRSTLQRGVLETDKIRHIGSLNVVLNAIPIIVDGEIRGVVATFKEASRIQKIERKLRLKLHSKGFVAKYTIDQVKTRSKPVQLVIDRVRQYAATDASVLIEGETGTGKEVFAQSLHNLSGRHNQAFIAINCCALTESLLESELFGYEEGAFTGAKKGGKIGLFELAHRGTIFLDEIADISLSLQVKLLRVIEQKEVMRIGGDQVVPVDIRILSSAHKNLRGEIREGRFRADLYYRLATLTVALPALRDRMEDLPVLVAEYLHKYGKDMKRIPPRIEVGLQDYAWPGNIRELDSLIKRYVVLLGSRDHDETLFMDLLAELKAENSCENFFRDRSVELADCPEISTLKSSLDECENRLIEQALQATHYKKKEAAKRLGISFNTLWRKMNARQRHRQQ